MDKDQDKYIGQKKIKAMDQDSKTKLVKIIFEDDSEEQLSQKMATACLTQEPLDATALREHYVTFIVKDILQILNDYNIKKVDFNFILEMVKFSYEGWQNMAIASKFGVDFQFVTMSMIQEALDEGTAKGIKLYD